MGVTLARDDASNMTVYATGYVGADLGFDESSGTYDEDPMFLVDGGAAVLMKLRFDDAAAAAPAAAAGGAADPAVVFEVVLDNRDAAAATAAKKGSKAAAGRSDDDSSDDPFFTPTGMRVVDAGGGTVIIAATSHAGDAVASDDNDQYQMAALGLSESDGAELWRRAYPAADAAAGFSKANGTMSHTYDDASIHRSNRHVAIIIITSSSS